MPQMAPINWLMLLIFMIFFMMVISSLSYFNSLSNSKKITLEKKIIASWKW